VAGEREPHGSGLALPVPSARLEISEEEDGHVSTPGPLRNPELGWGTEVAEPAGSAAEGDAPGPLGEVLPDAPP
jgi:hypothetical protein